MRQEWKNPRTFQYDIDTGSIIQSGTIEAKSIKEARTLARQTTHKIGYTWGKNWRTGWIQNDRRHTMDLTTTHPQTMGICPIEYKKAHDRNIIVWPYSYSGYGRNNKDDRTPTILPKIIEWVYVPK